MFALASAAFDRLLYKKGRKQTGRDTLFLSDHELSRHNLYVTVF